MSKQINNEQEAAVAAADAQASAAAARVGSEYRRAATTTIMVDSCADFDPAVARALGVDVIRFPYVTSTGEHLDDFWETMSAHEFYDLMRNGERITTSAVTPGRYVEEFERVCERGLPVVYLGLTAGLSSSIESARQAAEMVRAEHPEYEIYVVDNCAPSAAAELLALEAVRLSASGVPANEIAASIEEASNYVHGYFTLDSLEWLAAGGRIPPAAAHVGGKLDLKPELSYDTHGALTLRGMCRGRKKALRSIMSEFRENFSGDTTMPVGIASSDAEKDAQWLEDALRKEPGCSDLVVIRSSISPVIGAHVGPGMVALIFWGNDRREHTSLTDRIVKKVRGR